MRLSDQLSAALCLREDYEDHELVDPTALDLGAEYRRLNQKLFAGKLGAYPMRWNNKKMVMARVISQGIKNQPSTHKVKVIEFSKMFEVTYRQFLDRLAHEMIHVFNIESGKSDFPDAHGYSFQREMKRINALGFSVVPSEAIPSGVKVRGGKNKHYVAVLIDRIGGKKTELTTTERAWKQFRDDLAKFPADWLANYEIFFVRTDHGDLQGHPVKLTAPRRDQRFITNIIPIELWDDIAKTGQRLGSIIRGHVT